MNDANLAFDLLLNPDRIEAYRLLLRGSGFAPVPCIGKRPLMDGWQRLGDATEHEVRRWTRTRPAENNTGILTRLNPAIDVDLLDEEAAEAAERMVKDRFGGDAIFPVRFGRPPKRAILLRCDLPFTKCAAELVGPLGPQAGEKIEVLCDGAQVLVDGIHPDTARPYSWHGGRPGEDFKRHDLAPVDEKQARAVLHDLVEMLARDFGYVRKRPPPPPGSAGGGQARNESAGGWAIDFIDHDQLAALAMRLLKAGMRDGSAVNMLRDNVEKLADVDEARRGRRLAEIPGIVSSARFKLREEGGPRRRRRRATSRATMAARVRPSRSTTFAAICRWRLLSSCPRAKCGRARASTRVFRRSTLARTRTVSRS
jgi:Bifunctional DNA primase/polymerase, N-terminal